MIEHRTATRVLALDVGKYAHWAFALDTGGDIGIDTPVANTHAALDKLFAEVPAGTLVVVDQKRNIGRLAINRARAAGLPVAYLPGLAAHQASRMFAGDHKDDRHDAMVIARTALGIPEALRPIGPDDDTLEAARLHAVSRDHHTATATRAKNRMRAILLESCPEFEALVDLSDPAHIALLEKIGGPWAIADTRTRALGALTRGANRDAIAALRHSTRAACRPGPARVKAENQEIQALAAEIRRASQAAQAAQARIEELLEDDETYRCLLTVPGIGPSTAAELACAIRIEDFASNDRLASFCGLAPTNRQSGSSIKSVSTSRIGNKRLKHLLIFSCNSIAASDNRFGRYYRSCKSRGMNHKQALKATARYRMKTIYAIMRDQVPYTQ